MGKIWCGGAVSKARTNCKKLVSFQTHIIFFSCYYQQYNTKTKLEKGYSTSSYTEYARICITQGTKSSYFFFPLSLVFPALLNVELSLREVGFSSRDEQKANWCSNDSSHCPSEGGTDLKSGWRRVGALNQLDFFPAVSEHHPFMSMWFCWWGCWRASSACPEHRPTFPHPTGCRSPHCITWKRREVREHTADRTVCAHPESKSLNATCQKVGITGCNCATCLPLMTSQAQWHNPTCSTVFPTACSTDETYLHIINRRKVVSPALL